MSRMGLPVASQLTLRVLPLGPANPSAPVYFERPPVPGPDGVAVGLNDVSVVHMFYAGLSATA